MIGLKGPFGQILMNVAFPCKFVAVEFFMTRWEDLLTFEYVLNFLQFYCLKIVELEIESF